LAPLAVRTQRAGVDLGFARPGPCLLSTLAVAELLTGPERVGLVGDSAGRREVGLAPLGMAGRGAGQAVELGEVPDPEVLVDIDVAVVALGGAAVGAQEAQFGPGLAVLAELDGVAGQVDAEPLCREGDDVAAEDLRLRPTGRQEHLVVAGQ